MSLSILYDQLSQPVSTLIRNEWRASIETRINNSAPLKKSNWMQKYKDIQLNSARDLVGIRKRIQDTKDQHLIRKKGWWRDQEIIYPQIIWNLFNLQFHVKWNLDWFKSSIQHLHYWFIKNKTIPLQYLNFIGKPLLNLFLFL